MSRNGVEHDGFDDVWVALVMWWVKAGAGVCMNNSAGIGPTRKVKSDERKLRYLWIPNENDIESYLNISFNDHREAEYEHAMKLRYSQTLARLDSLHERALAGELNFEVSVSRVGNNSPADDEFIVWVRNRW